LDESIATFRRAIDLNNQIATLHFHLGTALWTKKQPDQAIASLKTAIDLDPNFANAHAFLGMALCDTNQFAESKVASLRAFELLSPNAPLRQIVKRNAERIDRLIELDRKLPAILKGEAEPKDAAEQLALADLCFVCKEQYATAARFFRDAFGADGRLADNVNDYRFVAARAALLAGCGLGKDDPPLNDETRTAWRKQALAWLRDDLKLWSRLAVSPVSEHRNRALKKLQECLREPDLACVRANAIAKLPIDEQREWSRLWTEVEELLKKVQDKQ
jgi:tetratricopeptide (TPR) repeat protein